MKNKMYVQSDNGGKGLLIQDTDTGKWYYWSEWWLPVDLTGESDKINAALIRSVIENGDMYDADEFITEIVDIKDHEIPAYDGLTLDEIDRMENYEQDSYTGDVHPKKWGTTTWTAI